MLWITILIVLGLNSLPWPYHNTMVFLFGKRFLQPSFTDFVDVGNLDNFRPLFAVLEKWRASTDWYPWSSASMMSKLAVVVLSCLPLTQGSRNFLGWLRKENLAGYMCSCFQSVWKYEFLLFLVKVHHDLAIHDSLDFSLPWRMELFRPK